MTTQEEKNKLFAEAPSNVKRIMVAQDILQQIDAGVYIPTFQRYARFKTPLPEGLWGEQVSHRENVSCNVCGVGAAFVSGARFGFTRLPHPSGYHGGYFDEVFPVDLLRAIEFCFEHGGWGYQHYSDAWSRMRGIYQDIINNLGWKLTPVSPYSDAVWQATGSKE